MALYYRIIHYVKTITTTNCSVCQSKMHSHLRAPAAVLHQQRLELAIIARIARIACIARVIPFRIHRPPLRVHDQECSGNFFSVG